MFNMDCCKYAVTRHLLFLVEIKNVGSDCTKSAHDACKYLDDNNDGNENDENHKSRC